MPEFSTNKFESHLATEKKVDFRCHGIYEQKKLLTLVQFDKTDGIT